MSYFFAAFFLPAGLAAFFFAAMVSHLPPVVVEATTGVHDSISNIEERVGMSRRNLRVHPSRVVVRSLRNHDCAFNAGVSESREARE